MTAILSRPQCSFINDGIKKIHQWMLNQNTNIFFLFENVLHNWQPFCLSLNVLLCQNWTWLQSSSGTLQHVYRNRDCCCTQYSAKAESWSHIIRQTQDVPTEICWRGVQGAIQFVTTNKESAGMVSQKWDINPYLSHERPFDRSLLNLSVLITEYYRGIMSIPWLMMPWFLLSLEHQQPWHWFHRTNELLSCMTKYFNFLHYLSFEKTENANICIFSCFLK